MKLSVVGQTEMFINFRTLKSTKKLRAIICADEGNEVLVYFETLIEWGIIPECLPLPININDRVGGMKETENRVRGVKETEAVPKNIVDIKERIGSWRTDIRINQTSEQDFERDHEIRVYSHLKKKLIKMFQDVFKEDLEQSDRLDVPPVKIPLIPDHESVPAYNAKVTIAIPRYLESAARKEQARIIKLGALEEVTHPTRWCCKAFFVRSLFS